MTSVAILAAGAVSPLGMGARAFEIGAPGAAAKSAIRVDPELQAGGFAKPICARVPAAVFDAVQGARDRAGALLFAAGSELGRELDRLLPSWRALRVAWAIGTSGGGMPSLTRIFEARARGSKIEPDLARAAPYFGPLSELERALGSRPARLCQVLAACASSTIALGLGCRWLELGEADLVIAGGYDAMSLFIASGFESLGATTSREPMPFRKIRDGMALGEGAALVALAPSGRFQTAPLGHVLGFGATSDAVHVTAPDREGKGLAEAAAAALRDAGLPSESIDLVSAHATATPFNDAAESKALRAVLGAHAGQVIVQPYKGQIGHTLGAAGVLESLAALECTRSGLLPAAAGEGELEPEFPCRLLETNEPGAPRVGLKLSAAFGGVNAALVLGQREGQTTPRTRRAVHVLARGTPVRRFAVEDVSGVAQVPERKLARLDEFSGLAVGAAAAALKRLSAPLSASAGVIVGTAAATLEVNELFDLRRREGRPVEPRRFPPTSPNLAGGECSIAFGLRGPTLSVGASAAACLEALLVALDLLESGDADEMLVVSADHVSAVVEDIWRAAGWLPPEHGACAIALGTRVAGPILERERIADAHARTEGSGNVPGSAPGWPTFLAVLDSVLAGRG